MIKEFCEITKYEYQNSLDRINQTYNKANIVLSATILVFVAIVQFTDYKSIFKIISELPYEDQNSFLSGILINLAILLIVIFVVIAILSILYSIISLLSVIKIKKYKHMNPEFFFDFDFLNNTNLNDALLVYSKYYIDAINYNNQIVQDRLDDYKSGIESLKTSTILFMLYTILNEIIKLEI